MWNKIFLDFGEDETINFTSRKDFSGISHLYEAQTVATILSSTQVTDAPIIVSSSTHEFIALAIDSSLCVFKNDFSEAWLNTQFESKVESVAISQDTQLLIAAEHAGSLHVFYLPTKRQIIGIPLITPVNDGETFKSLFVNEASKKVNITVFGQGQLFIFSDINTDDLNKATVTENWSDAQKHLLSAKKYQFALSEMYQESQMEMIFHIPKNPSFFHLGYCGSGQYPLASGVIKEWDVQLSLASGDLVYRKAEVSSDGRYIFVLDSEGIIHVICSRTLILLRTLKTDTILDFSLVETSDSRSGAVIDRKLVCLVKNEGLHFEVLEFPTMSRLYCLRVSSDTHIVKVLANQENVYVVEAVWDKTEIGNNLSFRVRRISEALPEARLARLLRKQKYDEAEKFAMLFNLDVQEVYKAKSIAAMDKLSPWISEPLSTKEAEKMLLVAMNFLDKIKDLSFVVQSCLNATPTAAEVLRDLLQYAKKKVIAGQCEQKDTWLKQINEALNRLNTFQTLYPSEADWCNWFPFKTCDLMKEFLQLLKNEKTSDSFFLWKSHQAELCSILNDDVITEILQSIPENVPFQDLYCWLQDSFLVPVLFSAYSNIEELPNWLIQRAKLLELSEKDGWPENSIRLLEIFPNICEKIISDSQHGGPSSARDFSIYLLKRKADMSASIHSLSDLILGLKELSLLRKKYKCPLSTAEFCQEDKQTVAFLILDWLVGTKYMAEAINTFFRQFIKCASLNEDFVFLSYIKETLAAFPVGWWHWEKAPWEERVFNILKYISNPKRKLDATFVILAQAPVPWSPAISLLVEDQIENCKNATERTELETQKRLVGLKIVLLKYNLRHFNISSTGTHYAKRVMRFILEQFKPTALEDALVIANSFSCLKESDAYLLQMTLFLKKEMLDDFTNLLQKMPAKMLETCVRHLLVLVDGQLTKLDDWCDKDWVKVITYGTLFAIKHLLQVYPAREDDFQLELTCLERARRLQVEYDLYFPLDEVTSSKSCWEILKQQMESLLAEELETRCNDTSQSKLYVPSSPLSYSKIYRLGHLLGLPKDEIMGHLAVRLAEKHETLKAVSLCMEISGNYSKIAPVLFNVVRHFYENLHVIQDSVTLKMFQAIYKTIAQATAYCDFDILLQCIEVTSWTSLLCSLSALDMQSIQCQQEVRSQEWRYSCLYQDHGLRTERKNYLPQLITFLNTTCFFKDSSDDKTPDAESMFLLLREVILYLRSKGQEAAALRVVLLSTFTILPQLPVSEQQEVSAAMNHIKFSIIKSLLSRIVQMNVVDKNLALDLLCSLENKALQCFKELLSTSGGEFGALASISSIGVMYGELENQPRIVNKCQLIHKNALWCGRLSNLNISLKDAQTLESSEDIWKVLRELFGHPDSDLNLISLFCNEFGISRDKALHEYLIYLLLGPKVQEWSISAEDKSMEIMNILLFKAENVIREFEGKEQLFTCLSTISEKLNPYCYELIEFVLKNLLGSEKTVFAEKGLKLIRFLKLYKRANRTPTGLEMDMWLSNDQNDQLPRLATIRLPFYVLLGQNMWKIVSGELFAKNVDLWLTIAPLLNLDKDQILVLSVQNTFTKWVSKSPDQLNNSAWQIDHRLLEVLYHLGSQIVDIEVAIACSNWLLKRLPVGSTKVQVAKASVGLAKCWVRQANDQKSQECLRKLTITYHRLAIEQVLHDYDFTEPEYFALSEKPDQLIMHMLEKNAGEDKIFTYGYSKSVDAAVKEIALIGECNIGELCEKLLEKWFIHPESIQNAANETATLHFSWANIQHYEEKENTIFNLNRMINLLQYAPLANNIFKQLNIVLKDSPMATTLQKVQALRCLLIVADEKTIESVSGYDSVTIKQTLQELVFLTQLEAIQLPYSLEMFRDWNKKDLVESILHSHVYKPKAVLLASSLCLHYQLWDENLWDTILSSMVQMNMVSVLDVVLLKLGSKSFLWHSNAFVMAWNCILKDALRKEPLSADGSQGLETFFKMISCPCITDIDLDFFRREFESHGCIVPAVACALIKPHHTNDNAILTNKQLATLKEKLNQVHGPKHCLVSLSKVFQFAGRGND